MTNFKRYLEERIISEGQYIVDNMTTVREAAKIFGVSKSTVHEDITVKLPQIDKQLADDARLILDLNLEERSHRAGMALSRKLKQAN